MSEGKFTPKFKVWLEVDGKRAIGDQESQILEGIQKLGSFMGTAKALGISYAHAWNSIDSVSKVIGASVVEAKAGGKYGGGAKLTDAGLELLKRYQELERRAEPLISAPTQQTKQSIFGSMTKIPDFTVIGSDCIGVDIIVRMMLSKEEFSREVVRVGSSGGLAAIMMGEADVAGIHLFDQETGSYNVPFLRRYWIADKAVLIRGYLRDLGLIVKKGNPKQIAGVGDLIRHDVRFVNRSLGSGTRTMLDLELKKEFEKKGLKFKDIPERVKGYSMELKSHNEVAEAILKGGADAGLGIRASALNYKLDFLPVTQENFDFVVEEARLGKPLVGLFMEQLTSKEFSNKAKRLGLHTTKETGKTIYNP
ncbi:hypothetical protein A3K70_00335 [Candidatus Bathyarchaeota archaeon RBG_16_48_13]|nr:MAG: hypothetical protein A3K70_00335 [Candidatus Bathyarchaeota archaeon RBG_16_48_13]